MRIVILDDEPIVGQVLAAGVRSRSRNFSVIALSSPQEAIETLEGDDILVTDFFMPEMNGLEVARAAYERGWRGALFVMSGRTEALPQPSDGPRIVSFLKKPFPVETLLQVLFPPPEADSL
jgi:CheY-like chemotaxis protein